MTVLASWRMAFVLWMVPVSTGRCFLDCASSCHVGRVCDDVVSFVCLLVLFWKRFLQSVDSNSRLNKHTKLNIFFICTQIFYYYYFSPFLFPDVWKLKEMFAAVSHLTERSLTASCLDFLFRAVGWYSKLSVSFSAGKNTCQGLNMATDSDSWVHSVYISKSKNRAKAGILSIFQQGKGSTCKEA